MKLVLCTQRRRKFNLLYLRLLVPSLSYAFSYAYFVVVERSLPTVSNLVIKVGQEFLFIRNDYFQIHLFPGIRQPKRTLRESIELLSQQQERNHEDVIQKVTMLLDNMKTLETGQTLPIQQLEEAIRSLQNSMTNDHNNRVLIELMDTLEHLLGTPVWPQWYWRCE